VHAGSGPGGRLRPAPLLLLRVDTGWYQPGREESPGLRRQGRVG